MLSNVPLHEIDDRDDALSSSSSYKFETIDDDDDSDDVNTVTSKPHSNTNTKISANKESSVQ